MTERYVIVKLIGCLEGGFHYWNSADGWVKLEHRATIYSKGVYEAARNLPIDGAWVVKNESTGL